MPQFTYKQISFSYRDIDRGPAVIFLHGFLENQWMWREMIEYLPKSIRKISLDLPGHGESGNLGYIHTMEEMAEVVKTLMDDLKLKKVLLCGHSMGGYVALALAEKHPDLIRGIILMNSSGKADSEAKKRDRDRAIKLVKSNHKGFIRNAIPHLFRPKHRKSMRDTVNAVKKEALKTSKQGVIAALEGMKIRPDREVLLYFAPYNFLFVAAKNDPVFPFEVLKDQLEAHKVSPCITENGHMSHLEDKGQVFTAIKKFIWEQVS